LQKINACTSDTVSIIINSYNGVNLNVRSFLTSLEINNTNDTTNTVNLYTKGHPNIFSNNDTTCFGANTFLTANGISSSDTTIWYDSLINGNILGYGDTLLLNNPTSSQTYFCESVRGNLFFEETLFTTTNTTTNWNGIMFDILALDTITVDSLMIKINTTGQQGVVSYKRTGSHFGNEMNSSVWTLWGIDTVQVNNIGDFKALNYSDELLYPNDTLGIYLHMQNSSAQLSYQNTGGSNTTYSNNKIEIASGTGISYTYGTTYYPRNFSGEVFYHHGFNPSGECTSDRIPVNIEVLNPVINLGSDTILNLSQSILLSENSNFNSYLWSNNSNGSQLLVDTSNFNIGNNNIWVEGINSFGCIANDTIDVTFSNLTNIEDFSLQNLKIFPNPTNGIINIEFENKYSKNINIQVFNIYGKVILNEKNKSQKITINLKSYTNGIYFVKLYNENDNKTFKIIKE
ncbi:MAG: T9SS type A sorting domain-containing protein, partial [Vicingaceae bacterium]|nr:T9SS type A sorting domain-containing protein [Vicingaceae bacterium]